jgi:hypothetical protein
LPAGIPTEISSKFLENTAKQYASPITQAPVEVVTLANTIESSRLAYAFEFEHIIVYWRNANMALDYNVTSTSSGWKLQCDQRKTS